MRKILKVAQREYLETVKTKTFLLSLLLLPVIIGGVLSSVLHEHLNPGLQSFSAFFRYKLDLSGHR